MEMMELRKKSDVELKRLLSSERERLRDLRFRVNAGQLKNVRDIRHCRSTIAQVLTLLKQKKVSL